MMKALLLNAEAKTAAVQTIPIPKLTPTADGKRQLLIRINSVALNPVDSIYVFNPIGATGRIVGSDFAGVVVDTSPDPATSRQPQIKIGDRVAGLVQGANSVNDRPGAFAEYILMEEDDLIWKVPEWMTLEQAAAVSLCGLTAAQGIYSRLGLPAPWESTTRGSGEDDKELEQGDETTVLIYGASSSLGMYAAQLVRLSPVFNNGNKKLRLIGLASKSKHEVLKSSPYEYDHLLDYHDHDWPEQVLNLTDQKGIDFALDCISEGDSVSQVLSTLNSSKKEKQLAVFRSRGGGEWTHPEIIDKALSQGKIAYGAVWEGLGADIHYSAGHNQRVVIPATKEARVFTVEFYKWLSGGGGRLEPNPIRLMPGGLEKIVPDGLVLLGGGLMDDREKARERTEEWMRPVSGEKLVYRIRD